MTIAVVWERFNYREEGLWLFPLLAMIVGLYLAAEAAAFKMNFSALALVDDYVDKALRALPLVLSFILVKEFITSIRLREASPTRRLINLITTNLREPVLLAGKLLPLALMPMLLASLGMFKMLMPTFAPFAHDALFARLDAILFFGHNPWELSHAAFGSLQATKVIDWLYTLWVFLLSVAIVFFAFAAPRTERARFFLAFTATWILLGVIGAYLGSSAGPCFVPALGLDTVGDFDQLMSRLDLMSRELAPSGVEHGLGAVGWQAVLWNAHDQGAISFSMGISAMPSLHNAIAVLYVFAAFRFGRIAGWTATIFAVAIFIGSVHLGWHYAVDGIVSAVAVYAIWKAVSLYLVHSGYDEAVRRGTENDDDPFDGALSKPA